MAALLVGMSVMAVLMTVAIPVWRQSVQRDKELELIFRGQQFARAIGLFQKKAGPGVLPPNVELLVEQRFLRKRYTDPITGQDFNFLTAGQAASASGASSTVTARGSGASSAPTQANLAPSGSRGAAGGIMGVASKSREKSIRIYNGRTRYDEWQFLYVEQTAAAGASGAGGRGAQPQQGGESRRRPSTSMGNDGRGGRGNPGGPNPGAR